jgi:anaerobic selenocysteine-containing dehydrogenase
MKRIGERGEGKWERVSWDEAYGTIEKEFKNAIDNFGPESVVAFTGTGRNLCWEPGRLIYSLGSPNNSLTLSGISCYMPRLVSGIATYGAVYPVVDASQQFEDRYDNPEWKVPEVIIIWGCNIVLSNPDWFFGAWIIECMKRGARLIQVDPRMTWMSARAEVWLGLRPGTDGALALAMLNVIIEEGLYDFDFVDRWTDGFDELAEAARKFSPEVAAKICWIDAEKIRQAARLYANARPGSIQLGLAVDMQSSGLPAAQAIMALQCITGNLDVPGGCIFCPDPFNVSWGSAGLHEFVSEEARARTFGHDRFPVLKHGITFPSPDAFIDQLESGEPYPIKAALMQGNNFLTCMGQDPLRWQAAAQNIDFFVAVDLFMTPTIQSLADLVLPATTFVERNAFRAQFYNLSTVNAAIDCYEDTRTDLQIVLDIGKRLAPEAWDYEDEIAVLDMMLKPSGMSYNDIKENKGWAYPPFEYKKYEKGLMRPDGQAGFMTQSGRVEFNSGFFAAFGLNPLPDFDEPYMSPVSKPEIFKEYPIVLMTGARSPVSFHSEHRQVQSLREIIPDPLIEINPEDAKEFGVIDGDWVWIENPKDRIRQKACITKTVQRGMALSYHAWWYPEIKDPALNFGMWEVNNNRLLEMGHVGPSGFGSDIKSTLVKIYKADTSPLIDLGVEGSVN